MKNIGICVSGLLRSWDYCYKQMVTNLILPNKKNYNFYLIGYINGVDDANQFKEKYDMSYFESSTDGEIPDLEYQKKLYTGHQNTNFHINAYKQLYDLKELNSVIKKFEVSHNINLDVIIRYRTDFNILTPFILPEDFNENTLYLPLGFDFGGYNDRFSIGKKNVMNFYLNRFYFWMEPQKEVPNYSTHIETNLKFYINLYKIKTEKLTKLNYSLRRKNGNDSFNWDCFYDGVEYNGRSETSRFE